MYLSKHITYATNFDLLILKHFFILDNNSKVIVFFYCEIYWVVELRILSKKVLYVLIMDFLSKAKYKKETRNYSKYSDYW